MLLAILLFAVFLIVVRPMAVRTRLWTKLISEEPRPIVGNEDRSSLPCVSVIIAVRNGADHIQGVINDLIIQDHPPERFEVIIVNDHSSDDTLVVIEQSIIGQVGFKVLSLTAEKGKKHALKAGVEAAQNELILFTDADVRFGRTRLSTTAAYWNQHRPDLMLMPVRTQGSGWLSAVQAEEQVALLGSAIGSAWAGEPVLANGANMAVERDTFLQLQPYADNFGQASGDDMFLLDKVLAAGGKVRFLAYPSIVVTTPATNTMVGFIKQRLRWSGKMHAVSIAGTRIVGRASILTPLVIWVMVFLAMFTQPIMMGFVIVALVIWIAPVVRLVNGVKRLLHWPVSSFSTAVSLLLFGIYAPLIALMSTFVKPHWKGRRI